jgi:hypothetical protein
MTTKRHKQSFNFPIEPAGTMIMTQRAIDRLIVESTPAQLKQWYTGWKERGFDILIFPDELIPELEKEFPGKEITGGMVEYIKRHPEIGYTLKKWSPEREAWRDLLLN